MQFSCDLPLNDNGDVQVPAGTYMPSVYVPEYGYLDYADGITGLTFTPTITSITPTSGSVNGGTLVQIDGQHFYDDENL